MQLIFLRGRLLITEFKKLLAYFFLYELSLPISGTLRVQNFITEPKPVRSE